MPCGRDTAHTKYLPHHINDQPMKELILAFVLCVRTWLTPVQLDHTHSHFPYVDSVSNTFLWWFINHRAHKKCVFPRTHCKGDQRCTHNKYTNREKIKHPFFDRLPNNTSPISPAIVCSECRMTQTFWASPAETFYLRQNTPPTLAPTADRADDDRLTASPYCTRRQPREREREPTTEWHTHQRRLSTAKRVGRSLRYHVHDTLSFLNRCYHLSI